MTKVALITGGASGMGLAVAQALVSKGEWTVHLVDINSENGNKEASALGYNAHFHKVDVTSYASLSSTFQTVYDTSKRLDFVFANAGVVERYDFYTRHGDDKSSAPPPAPDQLSIDVDLKSVVNTVYLALHYFRLSAPVVSDANIMMTSSCGGIYSTQSSPLYSAAKHGVLGLLRSLAYPFYADDNIRVNAICPGPVWTNLIESSIWDTLPERFFTPLENIARVVTTLVEGGTVEDSTGRKVSGCEQGWGNTIEMSGKSLYFRDRPELCDDVMREIMESTEAKSEHGKMLRN